MKTRVQPLLGAALLILSAWITGCNKPADTASSTDPGKFQGVIKIGEFASLTGKEAAFGISSHNGTQLAIDELNAAGGVLGKELKLLTEDDQSKAGEPATVVRKLITRENVVAILGEVASSRSLEAAPICQQNKIPMISPSSTNPRVTEIGDYIFRVCFIDPFQGTVMANFAKNSLKAKSVAILTDVKADYSMGLAKFFKERFVADGGKVLAEQSYSGGDKDFKAQLTSIKASNPDGLFIPGYYTDVGLILSQAKELGIQFPMFGGDGWESTKLIEISGAAAEGMFFSTHYSPELESAVAKTFVQKYQARYKEEPDAMAALGYDSAFILVEAIRKAGSTEGSKIRDVLASTKDFMGVTGKTTIDAQRNVSKPAVILTIKQGKFKYVETIAP